MAIAGLVLSGLWVLGVVVLVVVFLLIVDKGTVGANEVKAGDCLTEMPASGLVLTVDTASCDEPHKARSSRCMTMPDGDFPGQSAIEEYQNKCAPELAKYSPEASPTTRGRAVRAVPERRLVGRGRPRRDLHRDQRYRRAPEPSSTDRRIGTVKLPVT